MRPNYGRLFSVVLLAFGVGIFAVPLAARVLVAHDGASLDAGETAQWFRPDATAQHGGYWDGTYRVEEVLPGDRYRIKRVSGGRAFVVHRDELEPVNRW